MSFWNPFRSNRRHHEDSHYERPYRRDRNQYYRDEQRDFERGADYIPVDDRFPAPYESRDYRPRNSWERQYRDQAPYASQEYAPSRDYGYDRDEYYEMDRAHRGHPDAEAVGYGNYRSSQGRDFEHWLHDNNRFRNFNAEDFRDHRFPNQHPPRRHDTAGFEAGLYDYRQEQQYQGGRYRRRGRPSHKHYTDHKLHNRTDRHLEIVRPFKDPEDYGRNDYNESWGYGSDEMAYHER